MSQNLISLNMSEADWAEIDAALSTLEDKLSCLVDLSVADRRSINKLGDKSEAFCRQTLLMLAQHPGMVPPSLDMTEVQRDQVGLDALRSRLARLRRLTARAEDSEMALGSDLMSAALEGYAILKVLGKGSGLDQLRKEMSARFTRSSTGRSTPRASH